jgi:energy-coupling factor transport system permease protein
VSRSANPVPWITWLLAVTLATVATRDPLYLALVLLAVSVVYRACVPKGTGSAWVLVIRIGLVVVVASILFNLFTVHAGFDLLFRLPPAIPIAGGDVTANALLYGISSALAILTLIVAAATFASVIDRATLLRTLPDALAPAGTAAIIGLSFFPQTLASLREVREAQAARGFRVRSVRDVTPLVVPVLSLGLEGAFDLAEAMESRAFGSRVRSSVVPFWVFPTGILLTIVAVSLLIAGLILAAVVAGGASLVLTALGLFGGRSKRSAYRASRWRAGDWVMVATSAVSATAFSAAILFLPGAVEWSPFPAITAPPFSPWLGAACMLLVTPALATQQSS